MTCSVKPDTKDGRLVCAECKTALPEGACWCPKCGPENPDGCQQGYCTAKPHKRDWKAVQECLVEAAVALETFCKHSERLRPYDNVKDAEQTAKRCRFLAAFATEFFQRGDDETPR